MIASSVRLTIVSAEIAEMTLMFIHDGNRRGILQCGIIPTPSPFSEFLLQLESEVLERFIILHILKDWGRGLGWSLKKGLLRTRTRKDAAK